MIAYDGPVTAYEVARLACGVTLVATGPALAQRVQVQELPDPATLEGRLVALAGARLVLPLVASAETSDFGQLSTVLEIASVSDAEARYTVRFIGVGGTPLAMPVQIGCPTCFWGVSRRQDTVLAHGGHRIAILPTDPPRIGWAEFTSNADDSFLVSALLRAEGSDGTVSRVEIPPASMYLQAWLYTDNTDGSATTVILVNPGTEAQTLALRYRDFSDAEDTCEASVELPSLGQGVVETGTSLACSSGNMGLTEIVGESQFSGIALVVHDADRALFARSLFARPGPSDPYPLLGQWTVANGTVTYGANVSAGCVSVSDTTIDGAVHTVHASRWQRRADAGSPWTDVSGTVRTGMVCAYTPPAGESGQYRGMAEISIDGTQGIYVSNSITAGPATTVATAADLVVASASVSDASLAPGQSFEVRATVRNAGTGASIATTLRSYRSGDAVIARSDTGTGTAELDALAAAATSSAVITLAAPSTAGTYHYGVCVDPVPGESDTGNNCSGSTAVTVRSVSTAAMIPDAALRAAVEAALGKASGAPITSAEMAALARLDAQNSDIRDLTGLELATNLTDLMLSNSSITDLSPLAGLTRLTALSINAGSGGTAITDLSPLAGLTNLTKLSLFQRQVTDVSPLAGLTNLRLLNLGANTITDVSPLAGLTNLASLSLWHNMIADISALSALTDLRDLDVRGNLLSEPSINDHVPVLEGRGARVRFHSLRKGDFDMELVFLADFTEVQRYALRWAARRWMSVITGDLPDYEAAYDLSYQREGHPIIRIPLGERIDDVRVYASTFHDSNTAGFASGMWSRDTGLPAMGFMAFNSSIQDLRIVALHEMGHVLGFNYGVWNEFGLYQQPRDGDTHFNGPLAIAAFDDAGGREYDGAKVPLQQPSGSHWRGRILDGELMTPFGGQALSAITVQSLADLGYGVDVTQADAYTLPGAVTTQASAKVAAAIHGDDLVRGSLASPAHAEPKPWCGLDSEREPIDGVDQRGRGPRSIDD